MTSSGPPPPQGPPPPHGPQPGSLPPPPQGPPPPQVGKQQNDLLPAAFVSLVAALLGFVLTMSQTSSTRVNGVITSCSYLDFSAILFGIVGVVAGWSTFSRASKTGNAQLNQTLGGIGALFGVINLARGFGFIFASCA